MMAKAHKLTPKQSLFVGEYIVNPNAALAALKAGYSKKTAKQMGTENLSKPSIAEAIKEGLDKRAAKLEITAERVLAEYAKLGFANMDDYVTIHEDGGVLLDFSKLPKDGLSAVQSIEQESYSLGSGEDGEEKKVALKTKFKLYDKKSALDSIAKHLGMFTERIKLEDSEALRAIFAGIPEGFRSAVREELERALSGRSAGK